MHTNSILAASLIAMALSGCGQAADSPPPPTQGPVQPPAVPVPPVGFTQRSAEVFIQGATNDLVTLGYFHSTASGIIPLAETALRFRPASSDYTLTLPYDMSGPLMQIAPDYVEGYRIIRPTTNFDSILIELIAPGLGAFRNHDVALFIGGAAEGNPTLTWFHAATARPTPQTQIPVSGTIAYGGDGTAGAPASPEALADVYASIHVNHDAGTVSGWIDTLFIPCFMSCTYPTVRYDISGTIADDGRMTLALQSDTLGLLGTATAILAGPDASELALAFRADAPQVDWMSAQPMAGAIRMRLGGVPPIY